MLVQNPAQLTLGQNQLTVSHEGGQAQLPIEDLIALILESPRITLTQALLASLNDAGVAVISCDDKHMPNGLMLPLHPHSRQSAVAAVQSTISEPLKKRLWQKIIITKLRNSGKNLELCQRDGAQRLYHLTTQIQSGDPDNVEAVAARYYFTQLWGDNFVRFAPDGINAAMNYGYAIMRAMIARALVAYGLLPCFGLHHDNQLNAFNLADDMIEPFRPIVDRLVFTIRPADAWVELTREERAQLAALGGENCFMNNEIRSIANAAELCAQSLVNAMRDKNPGALLLPELIDDKS